MSTDTLIEPPAVSESNPEEVKDAFVSPSPEAPTEVIIPDEAKQTTPPGIIKAEEKAEKKRLKKEMKKRKGAKKALAGTFPMVELIDEQVRTSIPADLVKKVKGTKSKKDIISSTYPYPKVMKKEEYLEGIE